MTKFFPFYTAVALACAGSCDTFGFGDRKGVDALQLRRMLHDAGYDKNSRATARAHAELSEEIDPITDKLRKSLIGAQWESDEKLYEKFEEAKDNWYRVENKYALQPLSEIFSNWCDGLLVQGPLTSVMLSDIDAAYYVMEQLRKAYHVASVQRQRRAQKEREHQELKYQTLAQEWEVAKIKSTYERLRSWVDLSNQLDVGSKHLLCRPANK